MVEQDTIAPDNQENGKALMCTLVGELYFDMNRKKKKSFFRLLIFLYGIVITNFFRSFYSAKFNICFKLRN